MRPRLLLTINWGLHTRTAVARLHLRQLGFLVYRVMHVVQSVVLLLLLFLVAPF